MHRNRIDTVISIFCTIFSRAIKPCVLNKAICKLSERERTIVELRFGLKHPLGLEMTQKEVADLLGISQSYISRLEKKIIRRLKKEILKYE